MPQEPQFIFWYHNDRMINYDSSADDPPVDSISDLSAGTASSGSTNVDGNSGGLNKIGSSSSNNGRGLARTRYRPRVEVVTETDSNSMDDASSGRLQSDDAERSVSSQLTIRDVTDADSGNYTCAPSNAEPASTMIYVSEGESYIT